MCIAGYWLKFSFNISVVMSDEDAEYLDSLTDQDDEAEDHDEDARKNLLSELDSEAALVPQKVSSDVPPDKEHMKIFLRIRPFSTPEIIAGENQVRRVSFNCAFR